jgi:hypothetical protein
MNSLVYDRLLRPGLTTALPTQRALPTALTRAFSHLEAHRLRSRRRAKILLPSANPRSRVDGKAPDPLPPDAIRRSRPCTLRPVAAEEIGDLRLYRQRHRAERTMPGDL